MKNALFSILLALLFISNLWLSPTGYGDYNNKAQKDTEWILPQRDTGTNLMGAEKIKEIQYTPDGSLIAIARGYGVILHDVRTQEELFLLRGHTDWVQSVSFSPDGQTLASGSWDKTIRLWDVATGDLKKTLTDPQDWVWSVSFSPDGKTLVSGSWGTIYFWDVATGDLKKTFADPELK